MDIKAKLKQIEEHFKTLSIEEFEKNLVKAGLDNIRSSKSESMFMVTKDEIKEGFYNNTYSHLNNLLFNNKFDSDFDTYSFSIFNKKYDGAA